MTEDMLDKFPAKVSEVASLTPGKYGAGSVGPTRCPMVCDDRCQLGKDKSYRYKHFGCYTMLMNHPHQPDVKINGKSMETGCCGGINADQYDGDDFKNIPPYKWGIIAPFTRDPFAGWSNPMIYLAIVFNLFQSWMSGLITKVLSSLTKNIASAVALVLIVVLEYALLWTPQQREQIQTINFIFAIIGVFLGAIMFILAPKAPKKKKLTKEEKEAEKQEKKAKKEEKKKN